MAPKFSTYAKYFRQKSIPTKNLSYHVFLYQIFSVRQKKFLAQKSVKSGQWKHSLQFWQRISSHNVLRNKIKGFPRPWHKIGPTHILEHFLY